MIKRQAHGTFDGKCYYNIENLQNVEMLFDRYVAEIVLNDGENDDFSLFCRLENWLTSERELELQISYSAAIQY